MLSLDEVKYRPYSVDDILQNFISSLFRREEIKLKILSSRLRIFE